MYSMAIVMWELVTRYLRSSYLPSFFVYRVSSTRCITGKYKAPFSDYPDVYNEFQIIYKAAHQNKRPIIPPNVFYCF